MRLALALCLLLTGCLSGPGKCVDSDYADCTTIGAACGLSDGGTGVCVAQCDYPGGMCEPLTALDAG